MDEIQPSAELAATPIPLALDPSSKARHSRIQGTAVKIGESEWLLALDPQRLGEVWDRLYDDATIKRRYKALDLRHAAVQLLGQNYDLTVNDAVKLALSTSPADLVPAIERALFGPAKRHRTYTEWVEVGLAIIGRTIADTPPEIRTNFLEVLVDTNQHVSEAKFVSSLEYKTKMGSLFKGIS